MARSSFHPANYNPRAIPLDNKVKLGNSLNEFGLVENLIYNARTGNLIGGHQRLSILDQKAKGADYSIPLCVLDVSPTREKELNLALNNPSSQGWWEWQSMAEMIASDKEIDIAAAGFEPLYLEQAFTRFAKIDDLDLSHVFAHKSADPAEGDAKEIEKIKASKEEFKAIGREANDDSFSFSVVFTNPEEKVKFLAGLGFSTNARHVEGRALVVALSKLGCAIDTGWSPPADPVPDSPESPIAPLPGLNRADNRVYTDLMKLKAEGLLNAEGEERLNWLVARSRELSATTDPSNETIPAEVK